MSCVMCMLRISMYFMLKPISLSIYRQPNHPPARGNGANCTLDTVEDQSCNEDACPRCEHNGQTYEFGEEVHMEYCDIWCAKFSNSIYCDRFLI